MRDEPIAFDHWVRRDLKSRFDAALRESVPDELLALLGSPAGETSRVA